MKSGTTDLLKFKKLQRRLNLPTWQAVGLLETLWQATAKNAPAGDIGKFSDEDIAAMIDYRGDESELVAALVDNKWLDESQEHRLVVHDWSQHVPNWLKGNFTKHHKSFADEAAKQIATKQPKNGGSDLTTKPSQTKSNQPSQAKPNHLISTVNQESTIQERHDRLFDDLLRRMGRPDGSVALVDQVAWLVVDGQVSENSAVDAACGASSVEGVENTIGYFRTCLKASCAIDELLRGLPKRTWRTRPPPTLKLSKKLSTLVAHGRTNDHSDH